MIAEDTLWGLRQAGRRLERYVEDFIEQIDFALAHLLLRTSTYRPNGSDRLPKPKPPPWFSGAPPASSAPCRCLQRNGVRDSRGNPSRRSQPMQDSRRSRLTEACHSRGTQGHRLWRSSAQDPWGDPGHRSRPKQAHRRLVWQARRRQPQSQCCQIGWTISRPKAHKNPPKNRPKL